MHEFGAKTPILLGLLALFAVDAAVAADGSCPIAPEPLPYRSWIDAEQASADELFMRARQGLRHYSGELGFRRAIQGSLQALIRREPDNARGLVELARFAMTEGSIGRFALSEPVYDFTDGVLDRALELDPEYAPAWALEGLFRLHRRGIDALYGSTSAVESALAEAERLDPASSDVAFAWASYYSLRFRHDLAIREMQRLLEQPSVAADVAAAAYRRLATYYRDDGDTSSALAAAEEAIVRDRADPRNLLLYSSLALEAKGDAGEAVTAARLALCLEVSDAANRRLAYALYASWALDNAGAMEPAMNDDRLVEAVGRHADLADVVGYISEHERLAPLTRVLIRAGVAADTRDPVDGSTALLDAAGLGRITDVESLIELGADVDAVLADQERLLTIAIRRGDLAMVRLALAHGADVDAWSQNGTALMLAANLLDEAAARALIEAGADVNITDENGDTPLSRLALSGDDSGPAVAMMRLLLEAGADPNPTLAGGMPLIDRAGMLGLTAVVELLLESARNGA